MRFYSTSLILVIFVALTALSFFLVLFRVFVGKDYLISQKIDCDPQKESCFYEEGESGVTFFKIQKTKAWALDKNFECSEENQVKKICQLITCSGDDCTTSLGDETQ